MSDIEPLCRKMTADDVDGVHDVLASFLNDDEYYGDSSSQYGHDDQGLGRALNLFIERPELGFVWICSVGPKIVGACVICFAISTSIGGIVAKMDDVHIIDGMRGQGVGSLHLKTLCDELRFMGIKRIDTSVHDMNSGARRFYERSGFKDLHESRLSLVI